MPLAASVLIDGPSELVFDYAIPEHLLVRAGCRVRVPLRNRPATGTVLRIGEAPESDFSLRFLTDLLDPEPLVTSPLLKLADWIAAYYGTPLEQVIRSIVPAAIRGENSSAKTRRAAVLRNTPSDEELATLAKRQHQILTLLAVSPHPIPVTELGSSAASPLKALAEKNFIELIDLQKYARHTKAKNPL